MYISCNSLMFFYTKAEMTDEQKKARECNGLQRIASRRLIENLLYKSNGKLQRQRNQLQKFNDKIFAEEGPVGHQKSNEEDEIRQTEERAKAQKAREAREAREARIARETQEERARKVQRAREVGEAQERAANYYMHPQFGPFPRTRRPHQPCKKCVHWAQEIQAPLLSTRIQRILEEQGPREPREAQEEHSRAFRAQRT